jgi:hypothetical protein
VSGFCNTTPATATHRPTPGIGSLSRRLLLRTRSSTQGLESSPDEQSLCSTHGSNTQQQAICCLCVNQLRSLCTPAGLNNAATEEHSGPDTVIVDAGCAAAIAASAAAANWQQHCHAAVRPRQATPEAARLLSVSLSPAGSDKVPRPNISDSMIAVVSSQCVLPIWTHVGDSWASGDPGCRGASSTWTTRDVPAYTRQPVSSAGRMVDGGGGRVKALMLHWTAAALIIQQTTCL